MAGAAELDGAEVEGDGGEGERGWSGGAEEADEVERGAGVGGDLEGADAGGGGVGRAGLRGEGDDEDAAGGGEDGGAVALDGEVGCGLEAVMWMGTVPVLARVTVWGCAALPTCVVAKVRELCGGGVGDEWGGVGGGGGWDGGGGAGEVDEVGAAEGVAFDDEGAGVGGGCGGVPVAIWLSGV